MLPAFNLVLQALFPIRDGSDFQNLGLLSGLFTKAVGAKNPQWQCFQKPATCIPASRSFVSQPCPAGGCCQSEMAQILKTGTASGFLPRWLLLKTQDDSVFTKARFPFFCQSTLSCGRILSSGAKTSRWRYRFSKTAGASPPSSPSRFNKILSGE